VLPVVTDPLAALEPDSPLVHPELGTNVCATWGMDSAGLGTGGDVEEAIRAAEADPEQVVIRRTLIQNRITPAFVEPRAIIVDPTAEQVTMWSATQVPHILRILLAMTQPVDEHELRVIAPDVGGGFGGKLQATREEALVLLIALRLQLPVKYTETRMESMQSAHHARDQVQRLTLTARKDGTITAFDVDLVADMGAYLGILTAGIPLLGGFMFNGIYKIPAYRFFCTDVFTNKVMTDAYRGAGKPEATFGIERMMDELAVELGLDPLEVRRRNWIKPDEFPYATVAGLTYDSGNYDQATDRALALFDYDGLRAEQARRRESGDTVQLGIGVCTFVELSGLAPSRVLGSLNYGSGGWEHAAIRMLPTGKVEVAAGTTPHGQGHATAFAQIVSDELGIPFEDITLISGDTGTVPRGMDTYGSRSLVVGGMAIVGAARRVVEKARGLAAHLLEADPNDLEYDRGTFTVRGTDTSKTIPEIALAMWLAHDLPDGMEACLDSESTFDPENFSYPTGTHLAAVEVDTETGKVTLRDYVCVQDVGVLVNPMIVDGQVHGGLTQGIGQAMYEEIRYSEDGQLTSGSLADYLVPHAPDVPRYRTDTTVTHATTNTLGVKAVGETGTTAAPPAIVNGVLDALRPLGVTDITMPTTPLKVWSAIRAARTEEGGAS
jgi:carbon-monoxide dehydrogenase large subunit